MEHPLTAPEMTADATWRPSPSYLAPASTPRQRSSEGRDDMPWGILPGRDAGPLRASGLVRSCALSNSPAEPGRMNTAPSAVSRGSVEDTDMLDAAQAPRMQLQGLAGSSARPARHGRGCDEAAASLQLPAMSPAWGEQQWRTMQAQETTARRTSAQSGAAIARSSGAARPRTQHAWAARRRSAHGAREIPAARNCRCSARPAAGSRGMQKKLEVDRPLG